MNDLEKRNKRSEYINQVIIGGLQAAVLFLPVWLLMNIISWIDGMPFLVPVFILALLSIFYGAVLFGSTAGQSVLKWVFSLPVTFLIWFCSIRTHFYIRSLNWMIPGYGEQSAGGGFASSFLILLQAVFCFVTFFTAIVCSNTVNNEKKRKFIKAIQNVICPVICVVIVLLVVFLEKSFPSYNSIIYTG